MNKLTRKLVAGIATASIVMATAAIAHASDIDSSVVDTTAPTGAVELAPGKTANITINWSVTGNQEGTATFTYDQAWALDGGVFAGSNPTAAISVGPRTSRDAANTGSIGATVTVDCDQPEGEFTLAVGAENITNTNPTGAKLNARNASTYVITVDGDPDVSCATADTTAPQIQSFSINDGDDWANSTAVTVDIGATDNVGLAGYTLSNDPITGTGPAVTPFDGTDEAHTLSAGDASAKTVYVRVFDAAGNYADANDTIGLDTIAPTSVVGGFTDGAVLPTAPTVSCSATDERSGVATHGSPIGAGTTPGLHTVTCNGATDNAGNSQTDASDPKSYTLAPIGGFNGNFDGSAVLKVKPNQAIPLKWAFSDGTTNYALLSGATLNSVTSSRCTAVDGVDGTESATETAAGASGLQLLPDNSYQMNWKAVSTTGCRALTVTMTLSSGGTLTRTILVNISK